MALARRNISRCAAPSLVRPIRIDVAVTESDVGRRAVMQIGQFSVKKPPLRQIVGSPSMYIVAFPLPLFAFARNTAPVQAAAGSSTGTNAGTIRSVTVDAASS